MYHELYSMLYIKNPMSKLCLNIYKATILNAHHVNLVCDVYVNLVIKKEHIFMGELA